MAFKMKGSPYPKIGSALKQTEETEETETSKSIAYGGIKDTDKNKALIKQQQILNDEKNEFGADWTDAEFNNWQNRMNAIRAKFEK